MNHEGGAACNVGTLECVVIRACRIRGYKRSGHTIHERSAMLVPLVLRRGGCEFHDERSTGLG
jgi:hypothetical protein